MELASLKPPENNMSLSKEASAREFNEAFIGMVRSGNIKQAAEAANDYTRVFLREDSFMEKILPSRPLSNSELDRQVDTPKPVRIEDLQPGSPGAISVPFAQLPKAKWMRGKRYRVLFDRIQSHKATIDVDELRTWRMDLRQVVSDDYIKDIAQEKDRKFLSAVETAVGAEQNATIAGGECASGAGRNWKLVDPAGITRDNLVEMLKIMPSQSSKLDTKIVLCNNLTIKDIIKWGRDEVGGDFAEQLLLQGWSQESFLGCKWVTTIKHDLVPNNSFYMFSGEDFMGKHYTLEDVTMHIEQKAYFLEFFAYSLAGASIANFNSCAKAKIVRA
jgi:hypothetical protein